MFKSQLNLVVLYIMSDMLGLFCFFPPQGLHTSAQSAVAQFTEEQTKLACRLVADLSPARRCVCGT